MVCKRQMQLKLVIFLQIISIKSFFRSFFISFFKSSVIFESFISTFIEKLWSKISKKNFFFSFTVDSIQSSINKAFSYPEQSRGKFKTDCEQNQFNFLRNVSVFPLPPFSSLQAFHGIWTRLHFVCLLDILSWLT